MSKYNQNIILERYNSLPEVLRRVMVSNLTADSIVRIGDFRHLSEDKISKVSISVGNVLLGLTRYDDFVKELEEETGLSSLICQSIFKDIDREIFAPVRKYLRQVYKPISESGEVVENKDAGGGVIKDFDVEMPEIKNDSTPKDKEFNAPDFEKPVESKDKKQFLSFLRFKKSESNGSQSNSEIGANTIVGKQEGIKPTLESPTSFVISFEDVQPQKEKIVSSMDFEGKKNAPESINKSVINAPVAEPIKVGTILSKPEVSEIKKDSPKPLENAFNVPPVRIVNYGLESGKWNEENNVIKAIPEKVNEVVVNVGLKSEDKPKIEVISQKKELEPEVKPVVESVPISQINKVGMGSAVLEEKKDVPVPLESANPVEKPIENKPIIQSGVSLKKDENFPNQPEAKKIAIPVVEQPVLNKAVSDDKSIPSQQPQVNPDNIVDLRKFKF